MVGVCDTSKTSKGYLRNFHIINFHINFFGSQESALQCFESQSTQVTFVRGVSLTALAVFLKYANSDGLETFDILFCSGLTYVLKFL